VKTVEVEPRTMNIIQGEDLWAPIKAYLRHHKPDNNTELLRMQQRTKAYQVIGDELYKTSVIGPLLSCISKADDKELLVEIHSRVCGGHIGSRAIASKISKQGFY
jgi:hypothetical protein